MRRGGLLFLLIGLIIIVGGLAAFLALRGGSAGVSADATAAAAIPTEVPLVSLVQARFDIEANTVMNDTQLLEVVQVPITEFDSAQDIGSISDVVGKLLINPVVAGQAIRKDNIREPGLSQRMPTAEPDRPRDKAYPFIVNNLSGVADQLAPGDFVDIVATFTVEREELRPGPIEIQELNGVQAPVRQVIVNGPTAFFSTKTIIQRAQVLAIVRPAVAPAAAEGEDPAAVDPAADSSSLPQVDAAGQPIDPATASETGSALTQGIWTVVLAVNDQEIELIEFSLQSQARTVLVLRGNGDTDLEPTLGVTLDLLVSEFGLPLPRALPPRVVGEEEFFTPEPTRTPAPLRTP